MKLPELDPKTTLASAPKTVDLDPFGAIRAPTIRLQPFVPLDGQRPRALTPEIEAILYGLVSRGVAPGTAARIVGLSPGRLKVWRSKHPEFARNLDAAEAHCQAQLEAYMAEHLPEKWLKARAEDYRDRPQGPLVIADFSDRRPESGLSKRLAALPDEALSRLVELGAEFKALTAKTAEEPIDASWKPVDHTEVPQE